jgi:hypothetical protein
LTIILRCADLSCLVSLPSKEGLYYVVDDTVTTLADGSQIVHSYGNEQALSAIAEGQSGSFAESFSDVFLAGEISAAYLAPLLALGGGGGGGSSSGGDNPNPPIYGTNSNDTLYGTNSHENIYGDLCVIHNFSSCFQCSYFFQKYSKKIYLLSIKT